MIIPRLPSVGTIRRSVAAALVFGATACSGPLTPDEQITVERYLVCFECPAPLQAVRDLAIAKPEATVDSLNAALLLGPGAQGEADADSLLRVGYVRDSAWSAAKGRLIEPRDSIVNRGRGRYVNGYRARGALGLGWIRTPRALAYLDDAIATGRLPASVLAAALFARDSLPPP